MKCLSGFLNRLRYLQGYAQINLCLIYVRLQSVFRLIPENLVLRSKIGLDNRFLPYIDIAKSVAYPLHALYFKILTNSCPLSW